jgi:transposase
MSKKRKVYTKEFKIEAIKLTNEIPASQVSKDLGISENSLSNWKKQLKSEPLNSFPGNGKLKPHDEELRRLKKENDTLRQERDILKKAIAIFSK